MNHERPEKYENYRCGLAIRPVGLISPIDPIDLARHACFEGRHNR